MYLTFMLGIAIFTEHSRRKIPKAKCKLHFTGNVTTNESFLRKSVSIFLHHEWNCRHFFFPTILSLWCQTLNCTMYTSGIGIERITSLIM